MSELILHQYAESPFSEKVRLLLGYKGVKYRMVEIPMIMPRPYVIPLTGGYRKTPVMQLGSNIYCDTAIICRVIDELYPDNTVFPDAGAGVNVALAHWTDTFFFRVAVAVAFQPKAMGSNPLFKDEEAMTAFMADRAQFSKGSTELQMKPEIAEAHFMAHLNNLDAQLGAGQPYLGGEQPVITDFSTYHCCWFINERDALRDLLDPFRHVVAWIDRMADFGHGNVEMINGPAALEEAIRSEPDILPEPAFLEQFSAGQQVEVMPIDYGFQPVRGELVTAGLDEIAVARTDDQAGRLLVHFPRIGFEVNAVKG